ncbi:hypothetical protein HPB49_003571 [Dermacentor silvarum]|uniref:Uncharacterized protein n=1 Tax=Dermacentor silvarum TaxID=543639 RepID=A0ACB8DMQ4_DERSI|nr:hypothetical protein HPB49_003571 [Dermacentor silvarum]
MTGTHMRVIGRSTGGVAMETEQHSNLGLFCETAGTYGRIVQRNIFGHSSDSQLHDILYPDCAGKVSSKENQSTAERNLESVTAEVGIGTPTGISSCPSSKLMMLSGSRAEHGRPELLMQEPSSSEASPESPCPCGRSFEDDTYESEGKGLNQSCGDNPGLLLSEPTCDEAHGAEDGGGDASVLAADKESSLPTTANESFPVGLKMAEPLASSRLAFFLPDSTFGDWTLDGGLCRLPLEIAMKRSLLPPLTAHRSAACDSGELLMDEEDAERVAASAGTQAGSDGENAGASSEVESSVQEQSLAVETTVVDEASCGAGDGTQANAAESDKSDAGDATQADTAGFDKSGASQDNGGDAASTQAVKCSSANMDVGVPAIKRRLEDTVDPVREQRQRQQAKEGNYVTGKKKCVANTRRSSSLQRDDKAKL